MICLSNVKKINYKTQKSELNETHPVAEWNGKIVLAMNGEIGKKIRKENEKESILCFVCMALW